MEIMKMKHRKMAAFLMVFVILFQVIPLTAVASSSSDDEAFATHLRSETEANC